MIYVRVELWRHGNPDDRELLGEAKIANISRRGKDSPRGDYAYRVTGKGQRLLHEGVLREFPRLRLLSWDLLYRILNRERRAINRMAREED